MNTADDIRINFAERVVLKVLERALQAIPSPGKKELFEKLKKIENVLTRMKYSYMDGPSIKESDMGHELKHLCGEIAKGLGPGWEGKVSSEISANIRFALNNLYNLPERMCLPDDPVFACDIRKGRVNSVEKGEKVLICKVDIGTRSITVVTNDLSVREGSEVAIIFLPPTKVYGTTSEGMFLGAAEGVLKNVEGMPGEFPRVPKESFEEARRKILLLLNKE